MSERRRRKSLSILRPPLSPLTPITEPASDNASDSQQKKRRKPLFGLASSSSSTPPINDGIDETAAPSPTTSLSSLKEVVSKSSMDKLLSKAKPKGLQRPSRPTSLLSPLQSSNSAVQDDDANVLTRTTSTPTFANNEKLDDVSASEVILHADIQVAGSMFRKKNQYFVLTNTHLLRFKSQSRASEMFSCIPSSLGRSSGQRHSRISSNGSQQEVPSPSASNESNNYLAISLRQIVAVYRLDDGRPYFSVQVSWLDEETMYASETTLQIHGLADFDLWLSSIRESAIKARLANPLPLSKELVEYTVNALEYEQDYHPEQFHLFKIVQRATKAGGRSSSDDLTKVTSTICILAIGIFKVHLIPLPKSLRTSLSSTSLTEGVAASHGVAALTEIHDKPSDDAFTLTFRIPLCQPTVLSLASFCANDIALWLRQAADYLRPAWLEQPFTWNKSQNLDDETLPIPNSGDDDEYSCLNRTLHAYCKAYDIDISRIHYKISWDCQNAPGFELQPPYDGQPMNYSVLELLAIMRALRYNESFGSISFRNIKLDFLRDSFDKDREDHVPGSTRTGAKIDVGNQSDFSLLVQEVQALAIKSRHLRRLDFSYTLTNRPTDQKGPTNVEDPGCGICEALFPLCAREYTNVDWITLDGITLNEADLDYLYNATIDRKCHFRAIELAYCGLKEQTLDQVLHALSHQFLTIESIELSGNPARLESSWLRHIRSFEVLRKLSLCDVLRTSAPEPLVPARLLMAWKLEEINLDRTPLNAETVKALCSYLAHPQSRCLKTLLLNQCQLTGRALADILDAQHKGATVVRNMSLEVTGNWVEEGHEYLVNAISHGWTPTHMTMQMMYYKSESNFRTLLSAFKNNETMTYLDISKFSLPCDASNETCDTLRDLFAFNKTLDYLDISSEKTHIEAAGFGRGLCNALYGLKDNKTLAVLKIHHQSLGLQGANALASVLEENKDLKELHCEDNEFSLQGFTTLVNSMEHNTSILYLPTMDKDRKWSQRRMDREVRDVQEHNVMSSSLGNLASTRATVRKTLGRSVAAGPKTWRTPERGGNNPVHIEAVVRSVSQNWDREVARLQKYLDRNMTIARGLPVETSALIDFDKPAESNSSLAEALNNLDFDDKTPKAELDLRLGQGLEEGENETTTHKNKATEDEVEETEETEKPLEIGQS